VPDAHFAEPRLAELYDPLDPDRGDLAPYAAIADDFGALAVLDIGCGTGTFACLLAQGGKDVTGVDPAAASLEVARRKPYADRVRWVLVEMATMTGNVAQVFLNDEDWMATLTAARNAMRPGGLLVFETRDPARQAWREWTGEHRKVELPKVGTVETWGDLVEVNIPFVSFRTTFVFASDGAVLTSDSTLRFRERAEVIESLFNAGFVVRDVRDAPDRPGLEFVFIASAT
jgi:SAM-dependent methyltransferase